MHSWFDVLQDKGDSPYFTVDEKTQFLNRAMTKYVNAVLHRVFLVSGKAPENNAIPYSSMESIQAGEDALRPIISRVYSTHSVIMADYNSEYPKVNKWGQISTHMINRYIKYKGHQDHDSSSMPDGSTWAELEMLHLISMRWTSHADVPIRYIRLADTAKVFKNSFTSPTVEDPVYFQQLSGRYEIQPRASADGTTFYNLWDDPAGGVYTFTGQPSNEAKKCKLIIDIVRTPYPLRYDPLDSSNDVSCELPDWTHDDIMAIALDDAGVASRDQTLLNLNQAAKANSTPPQ